jgi:hypothetical protein
LTGIVEGKVGLIIDEQVASFVVGYRAGGLRCLPKAGSSRATRDDSTRFFSLSEHFSEKALRLQIASTKVPTAADRSHGLADQRNAYANANIFRTTKRELSKNGTANQKNEQGSSARRRRPVSLANAGRSPAADSRTHPK